MPDSVLEPSRRTPVIAHPDVLVVGGGAAGLAAAVAAARSGAHTLLIERHGFLGGTLSAVTLGTLCGGYRVEGEGGRVHALVGGFYAHLVAALRAQGATLPPRRWLRNVSVPYDPIALREQADRLTAAAGVRVLLHCLLTSVQVDGDRVACAFVEHKGGRAAIRPKMVIDTTGDADLCARAGAGFDIGDDGSTQFASTMVRLGGVDIERFLSITRAQRLERLEQAAADGHALPRTSAGLQVHPGTGVVHANITRIREPDGSSPDLLDPWSLSAAEAEGRRQASLYEHVLREYMPGFEHARLVDMGAQLGVRESRLVHGDRQLTEAAVRGCLKPADTIACCAWPMEQHGKGSGTTWDWLPAGDWYGIPYGCLTVRGFDNLLVAGRNLSAEHVAQSSARVAATCMAMGEAAGTAAALAATTGCRAREVDVAGLRATLANAGALLQPGEPALAGAGVDWVEG